MITSRSEALAVARRQCRTLASAPDPRERGQAIFAGLARADGWSKTEQNKIIAFGAWLNERPSPSAMKARCQQLLVALA